MSNSPFLTPLFRSFFLKRPPSRSLVPSWNLPAVLRALVKAPFEPLKVSLYFLTVKTVFLIAIASGQRCSSIHALSVDPGHFRWENSGLRLMLGPGRIKTGPDPDRKCVKHISGSWIGPETGKKQKTKKERKKKQTPGRNCVLLWSNRR